MTAILTSAFTGALSGAIGAFVIGPARERYKLWALSSAISLENFDADGGQHHRILVHNSGLETVVDAIAYLTLNNEPADIVDGRISYEGSAHRSGVRNGRLSWAIAGNTHKIDIFPGEKQVLNFAQLINAQTAPQLLISSEVGFGDDKDKPARVSLIPKNYTGVLTIVGKNILSREFDVEIIVENGVFGRTPAPSPRAFISKWSFVLRNHR